MSGYIYLASPYSDPNPKIKAERFRAASSAVVDLMDQGFIVFSPIVPCHPLALEYNLPGDVDYWWCFNLAFLRNADSLFVLQLPGWSQSRGVSREIGAAVHMGLLVTYNKTTEHYCRRT